MIGSNTDSSNQTEALMSGHSVVSKSKRSGSPTPQSTGTPRKLHTDDLGDCSPLDPREVKQWLSRSKPTVTLKSSLKDDTYYQQDADEFDIADYFRDDEFEYHPRTAHKKNKVVKPTTPSNQKSRSQTTKKSTPTEGHVKCCEAMTWDGDCFLHKPTLPIHHFSFNTDPIPEVPPHVDDLTRPDFPYHWFAPVERLPEPPPDPEQPTRTPQEVLNLAPEFGRIMRQPVPPCIHGKDQIWCDQHCRNVKRLMTMNDSPRLNIRNFIEDSAIYTLPYLQPDHMNNLKNVIRFHRQKMPCRRLAPYLHVLRSSIVLVGTREAEEEFISDGGNVAEDYVDFIVNGFYEDATNLYHDLPGECQALLSECTTIGNRVVHDSHILRLAHLVCFHPYPLPCDEFCLRLAHRKIVSRAKRLSGFIFESNPTSGLVQPGQTQMSDKNKALLRKIYVNLSHGIYPSFRKNQLLNLLHRKDFKTAISMHREHFKWEKHFLAENAPRLLMQSFFGIFDKIEAATDKASGIMSSMEEMVNGISEFFTDAQGRKMRTFDFLVTDIVSLFAILYDVFKNGISVSVQTLALIVNMAVKHGVHHEYIYLMWNKIKSLKHQAGDSYGLGGFMTFVLSALAVGSSMKKDMFDRFNPTELTKAWQVFRGYDASSRGADEFFDRIVQYIKAVAKIILKAFGYSPELVDQIDDVTAWQNRIASYASDSEFSMKVQRDEDLAKAVINDFTFGLKLSKYATPKMKTEFSENMRILLIKYLEAIRSPVFHNQVREEPFCVYLYGLPGVGKSNMTRLLEATLCNDYITRLREENKPLPAWTADFLKKDMSRIRYTRPSNSEYYEGYNSQPVFLIDDFLQKSDLSDPNIEPLEVIQAVNVAPFPLNMASVEKKPCTFFNSRFVLLTSNVPPNTNYKILSDSSAFTRRLHVSATVQVKAKYYSVQDKRLLMDVIAKDKTEGIITNIMDIYEILAGSHGKMDTKMTYDQFIQFVRKTYRNKVNSSVDLEKEMKLLVESVIQESTTSMYPSDNLKAPMEFFGLVASALSATGTRAKKIADYSIDRKDELASLFAKVRENPVSAWWHLLEKVVEHKKAVAGVIIGCGLFSWYFTGGKSMSYKFVAYSTDEDEMEIDEMITITSPPKHPQVTIQILDGAITNMDQNDRACETERRCSGHHPMEACRAMAFLASNHKIHLPDGTYGITFDTAYEGADPIMFLVSAIKVLNAARMCPTASTDLMFNVTHQVYGKNGKPRKFLYDVYFESIRASRKWDQREQDPYDSEVGQKRAKRDRSASSFHHEGKVNTNMSLISNIVKQNVRSVCVGTQEGNKYDISFSILMIKSNVGIMPSHSACNIRAGEEFLWLDESKTKMVKTRGEDCVIHQVHDDDGRLLDICFIEFLKRTNTPSCRDITSHFIRESEVVRLSNFQGTLSCAVVKGEAGIATQTNCLSGSPMRMMRMEKRIEDLNNKSKVYYYGRILAYSLNTMSGDCGSPCFYNGLNQLGLPNGEARILGFHTLGVPPGSSYRTNFSQLYTYEDIQHYLSQIKLATTSGYHSNITEKVDFTKMELQGFTHIGHVPEGGPTAHINRRSKITESICIDEYPITQAPARMKCFMEDGHMVDPMIRGLLKATAPVEDIPSISIQRAVDEYFSIVTPTYETYRKDFPLSTADAINDADTLQTYGKIERSTSSGYPFSLVENEKSKHKFFGHGEEWVYDHPTIIEGVKRFEELAQSRVIDEVVFIDTLKDETRPIDKVIAGKTRVVSAGPVVFTVTFRKYYLPFITHIQEGRIDNEVAVGINPHDPIEWGKLRKWLSVYPGGKVFAGDFSNYDGTLNPDLMEAIFEKIIAITRPNKYDENVMRALYKAIIEAVHIKGDLVYQWTHGQPSGCPITSIINSLYNSIMARICYYEIDNRMPMFTNYIRFISYGDDNIFHIPDELAKDEFLNQFCSNYKKFGMTYTGTSKDKPPEITTIDNVEFLKRSFRTIDYKGCAYDVAPIEIDVLHNALQYDKTKEDPYRVMCQKLTMVLDEAIYHGPDVYRTELLKITDICIKHGFTIDLRGYEVSVAKWLALYTTKPLPFNNVLQTGFVFENGRISVGSDRTIQSGRSAKAKRSKPILPPSVPTWESQISTQNHQEEPLRMMFQSNDTVQFVDEEPTVTQDRDHNQMLSTVGQERIGNRDLVAFLERPESLKSIPITNTPRTTILAQYSIPEHILPIMKRDKLLGFKNVKFDICVEIKPSTSAFVSGKVIAFFYAQNEYNEGATGYPSTSAGFIQPDRVLSLTAATGCPHIVIDLSSGETGTLDMPYLSCESHWDLTSIDPSTASEKSLPTMYKLVIANYTDVFIDAPCTMQIFASLKNIDLNFATYPTRLIAGSKNLQHQELVTRGMSPAAAKDYLDQRPPQIEYPELVMETKHIGGDTVHDVVETTKEVATLLGPATSSIPIIGSVVGVAGQVANFLSSLGFSKKIHNADTANVQQALHRYGHNIDGSDDSRIFGLSSTNQLLEDSSLLGCSEDEMSFGSMMSRFEFVNEFNWKVSDLAGSMIGRIAVNPTTYDNTVPLVSTNVADAVVSPNGLMVYPTHMGFISQLFAVWRGSLEYRFTFAKTAFHVGRIRIMWLPGDQSSDYDPGVTYSQANPEASYFYQKVIDLRDTTEVLFTVPFAANRPYNNVGIQSLDTFPDDHSNGHIVIQALSDLSTSGQVSLRVPIVVEVRAGPDLEFGHFRGNPWFIPSIVGTRDLQTRSPTRLVPYPLAVDPTTTETYGGITRFSVPVQGNEGTGHVVVDNFPPNQNVTVTNAPAVHVSNPTTAVDVNNFPSSQRVVVTNTPDVQISGIPTVFVDNAAAEDPIPVTIKVPFTAGNGHIDWKVASMANPLVTAGVTTTDGPIQQADLLMNVAETGSGLQASTHGSITRPITRAGDKIDVTTGAGDSATLDNPMPVTIMVPTVPNVSDAGNYSGEPAYNAVSMRTPLVTMPLAIDGEIARATEITLDMSNDDGAGPKVWTEIKNAIVDNLGQMAFGKYYDHGVLDDQETLEGLTMESGLTPSDTVSTGVSASKNTPDATTLGESIFSFRALLNVFMLNSTIIEPASNKHGRPYNGFQFHPQSFVPTYGCYSITTETYPGHGGVTADNCMYSVHSPDLIDVLATMFGFWKGSVRTKVLNMGGGVATAEVFQDTSSLYSGVLLPMASPAIPGAPLRSLDRPSNAMTPQVMMDTPMADMSRHVVFIGNDVEARDIQIQHPYYHPLMMSRVSQHPQYHGEPIFDTATGFWKSPQLMTQYNYSQHLQNDSGHFRTNRFNVYRAVGGDFNFHFLQGIPQIALVAANLPGSATFTEPFNHI